MVFKREQALQQTSRRVGSLKRGNDFHTQLVAAAATHEREDSRESRLTWGFGKTKM
jgi:hypothetical protein